MSSEDEGLPTYLQFTPKRAMTSFENLVALANHQERLLEARKMIWRDRGEPIVELKDVWGCLEHAGRGGLRAGTLGFAMRAGVNLFLLLFRIRKIPKSTRFALIRHAVFGEDSFRFAAMLGSFVSLYKFILNALPIVLPPPSLPTLDESPFSSDPSKLGQLEEGATVIVPLSRRTARLSLSAQARQVWVRKQTRRWYAVLAGAIAGGIGILFEKKSRRTTIAQQMFVRGLQGSFNAFSSKRGIRIPHGDILVFSLCCGQIMYAFLMRPDSIPRSYNKWILSASKVPASCLPINKDLTREGIFDVKQMETIVNWRRTTPLNRADLEARIQAALKGDFGAPHGPCSSIHPWVDSCMVVPFDRFIAVFMWMFPIYGALHFIPTVLFKRRLFMKEPLQMLTKIGWGTTRSAAFLGTFVIIYQSFLCAKNNLYDFLSSTSALIKLPKFLVDILASRAAHWLPGFLCGLSLFVEEKRRREELAMYVLPKGLESAWVVARGRGLVFNTGNFGETLLCAIGMGMVMSTYQNDPQHLSGLVRRILYQFIGPN